MEAPKARAGLQYVTVLGAGGCTYGLGFFHSADEHEAVQGGMTPEAFLRSTHWAVWFNAMRELPFGDGDLWEDHHLPVAGENAYPMAIQVESGEARRRPDAGTLAYLEGLLRALADAWRKTPNAGRWLASRAHTKGSHKRGRR